MVSLVRRWHVPAKELLEGFGLSEHELERPNARLPASTMAALIERARKLTGEPGLGFHVGQQKHISMYGILGFAAMSAATLGESLAIAARYASVVSTVFDLRVQIEGGKASLILDDRIDLGPARDVELIDRLVGLPQIGAALTGEKLDVSIDVALPEPEYWSRYQHMLPGARFDQPLTQIVIDAEELARPLTTPDRAALRLASAQCEQALMDIGGHGTLEQQVRHLVAKPDGFRSLEEVAPMLRASPRTLKRKLALHGTTFSTLLEQERRQRALLLLRSPVHSIDDVSYRLGYSTTPAFIRAFRRWTGQTPAAYRRAHAG